MAILTILEYPDVRLRTVATPVASVTPEVERLVRDMAETMYAAPGVGLAATQVDVHQRIIVMDVSETRDRLRVFINPEILSATGEAENEEGCLSVPGYYDKVTRAERVRVRALEGKASLAVGSSIEDDHIARVDEVRVLDLLAVHPPDVRPAPRILEELAGNAP